jgi:uncharacterized protein YqjF (DUF2071 family)
MTRISFGNSEATPRRPAATITAQIIKRRVRVMALILPKQTTKSYAPRMPERPLLTAEWRNLLLLNFPVPTDIIKQRAPPGTEPDTHNGQSYISIVGFRFENVRLFGLPIPGHTNFPEINLRYYVRRMCAGELRRGVVFAREIVPRRAVAIVANRLYNENYVTRKMRSDLRVAGSQLSPNDTLEYAWRSKSRWNRVAAHVAAPLALPTPGSLEEFIIEHYWGYTRGRAGQTGEYQVAHVPWRIAAADNVTWDCDIVANYNPPLAEFLSTPPTTAYIADGSAIQVFRGRPCESP